MSNIEEKRRSYRPVVDQLKEKFANKVKPTDKAQVTLNKELGKKGDMMKKTVLNMQSIINKAKRLTPARFSDDELLKRSKSIIRDYCRVYKDLIIGAADGFWLLSAKHKLAPLDKFNPQSYRKLFADMESVSKKTVLTVGNVRKICKEIMKVTEQPKGSGFGDIGTSFAQNIVRASLPVKELVNTIKDFDGDRAKSIRLAQQAKAEAERSSFKKFGIVGSCDKLSDLAYRNTCAKELNDFVEELDQFTTNFKNCITDEAYKVAGDFRSIAVKVLTT